MEKQNTLKHRKNPRYKDFDYSSDRYYYVTICTYAKRYLFGEVNQSEVVLYPLGQIVDKHTRALNDLSGVNVTAHVVMPNHLHVLIEIANHDNGTNWALPTLISRLKSKVIVDFSHLNNGQVNVNKIWQRNYWDHIVRTPEELGKIVEYITRNPEFWESEQDNPENDYHLIKSEQD